jgi:hypothetical protein
MSDSTDAGLSDCVELVGTMWQQEVADHTHERQAGHAAAMLLSGSGIISTHATSEMIELVERALQIGYIVALKEVEDGDHDDDILQWRPDLPGS